MREVSIVLRRELTGYFLSPIAYVFGALFLVAMGTLTYGNMLIQGGSASMTLFFSMLPWMFLFFLPALTMRLWAEERKQGTLELLLTFPVTISQLIGGKFLAALGYLTLLLILTLGLPITLSTFAENGLDWGPVAMTYVACLLMASAYLSVGMFWSSITRDQIIAFLLALTTLVGLFFLGHPGFIDWLTRTLPEWPGHAWFILFVRGISPFGYFDSISRGMLDTGDLLYYVCFTVFFLHANALVLYGKRVKG